MFDPPPVIGQCIYCGQTEGTLQDEHIIPYGLNGTWELKAASCADCAEITSSFERDVLRKALIAPRVALGFRSYRPKKIPKTLPLEIDRGRGKEELDVPIEEHPAVAVLPRFEMPSWITSRTRRSGINLIGANTVYFGRIPLPDFVKKYKGTKLTGSVTYEPVAFARMVAKIAFGYCVARFGLDAVRNAYVLPAILGKAEDVGTWVGSTDGYLPKLTPAPEGRVIHAVGTDTHEGDIIAIVRLFAWAVPGEYVVVVSPMPVGHYDDQTQGRQYPRAHT